MTSDLSTRTTAHTIVTSPDPPDPRASTAGGATRSRWPGVIGTIGVVLSVIIIIDQIDDLLTLSWTLEDWQRIFAPGIAELIVNSAPPMVWRVLSGLIQIGLGVILFLGSMALRRRTLWGIHLCKLWAWLAIVWAIITVGWGARWLMLHAEEIHGTSIINWQGYSVLGLTLALVLMVAFPMFLLVWFSTRSVRAEYQDWPRS